MGETEAWNVFGSQRHSASLVRQLSGVQSTALVRCWEALGLQHLLLAALTAMEMEERPRLFCPASS